MKLNKSIKTSIIGILLISSIGMIGCSSTTDKTNTTKDSKSEEKVQEDKLKTWKGHELGDYDFIVYDSWMLNEDNLKLYVFKGEPNWHDTYVTIPFTFINEANETLSPMLCGNGFQNGIEMDFNLTADAIMKNNGADNYNNNTKQIQSGYEMESSLIIPYGDNSIITYEIHTSSADIEMTINPQTKEYGCILK